MSTLVCYISGHGFGHASRVIEVINALQAGDPDLQVIVRTTAARWLFDVTVRGRFTYQHTEGDTGIVQVDSLRLDAEASLARAAEFMATFEDRVEAEAAALARDGATLVLADMPPLGIAAAARAGIPVAAMGNFSWDWIYAAYPGSAALADAIAAAYAPADLAIRLPMWGGFDPFHTVVDVPFVARRSRRDPDETRRALGVPAGERLVLTSFGGHGTEGFDLAAVGAMDGYVTLFSSSVPSGASTGDVDRRGDGRLVLIDEFALYDQGFRYEDFVRAADVVVTKPGYGIIAECLANDTAILYTSRGQFIEYEVLVAAMPHFLRAGFIDHADLFAGRWQSHLDALLAQPDPPERPPTDGAEVAAGLLRGML